MTAIQTPDQNPKHRLHLKRLCKNPNLQSISLGLFNIVPYFNIKVRPIQARISISLVP